MDQPHHVATPRLGKLPASSRRELFLWTDGFPGGKSAMPRHREHAKTYGRGSLIC